MPEIIVKPEPGDLAALQQYMRRLRDELGLSLEQSVSWAAYQLARSLASGTRKAPKRRKLQPNPGASARAPEHRRFSSADYPNRVEMWAGKREPSWYYIPRGEGRSHPAMKIKRAGLAASSWKWMLPALGRAMGAPAVPPIRRLYSVSKQTGANPSVTLENRLSYIDRAVKLGGKGDINAAFRRAADAGFRYLENRARRAARAKA